MSNPEYVWYDTKTIYQVFLPPPRCDAKKASMINITW